MAQTSVCALSFDQAVQHARFGSSPLARRFIFGEETRNFQQAVQDSLAILPKTPIPVRQVSNFQLFHPKPHAEVADLHLQTAGKGFAELLRHLSHRPALPWSERRKRLHRQGNRQGNRLGRRHLRHSARHPRRTRRQQRGIVDVAHAGIDDVGVLTLAYGRTSEGRISGGESGMFVRHQTTGLHRRTFMRDWRGIGQ